MSLFYAKNELFHKILLKKSDKKAACFFQKQPKCPFFGVFEPFLLKNGIFIGIKSDAYKYRVLSYLCALVFLAKNDHFYALLCDL